MTDSFLNLIERTKLSIAFATAYRDGPKANLGPLAAASDIVFAAVAAVRYALIGKGSSVRVDLRIKPRARAGSTIVGLVIGIGEETTVLPLTLTPTHARLNGRQIPYLIQEGIGGNDFLRAVMSEVEAFARQSAA